MAIGVGALGLAAGAFLLWPGEERGTPVPEAVAPLTLTQGKTVYLAECAACHGADLEGEPNWRQRNADGSMPAPPHDDRGHTWHHPDGFLFAYTKWGGQAVMTQMGVEGVSAMPAFGDRLSDAEIAAVLAYIKSTWSPRSKAYQQALTEQEG